MPRPISDSEDENLSDECDSLLFPYRNVPLSDLGKKRPDDPFVREAKKAFYVEMVWRVWQFLPFFGFYGDHL